jgi:peptide chain release factor 1
MDYSVLIDKKRRRFEELEEEISGGLVFDNAGRARDVLREHARLKELVELWGAYQKTEQELEESQGQLASDDAEMAELLPRRFPVLEGVSAS